MTYGGILEDYGDPTVPFYRAGTPDLSALIKKAMRLHTMDLHFALPAFVLAVNGTGLVDVQPTLQRRMVYDDAASDVQAINNVPICLPSGAQYSIKVPIAPGDAGLLIFSDRSLNAWYSTDGKRTVDPADTRQHNLSDAVFLPGCWPPAGQVQDKTTDFVLQAGTSQVRLLQSGKLALGSSQPGGQELLTVLDAFMANSIAVLDMLAQATTLTMMGPQPFIAATQSVIANLKSQAQQIKDNLETIKGAT